MEQESKRRKKDEEEWEAGREARIGSWRNFAGGREGSVGSGLVGRGGIGRGAGKRKRRKSPLPGAIVK